MIKVVLFDIDGTLLDSFESNLVFFQTLMGKFGFTSPTREQFRSLFHIPMRDIIETLTGLHDELKIQEIYDFAKRNSKITFGVESAIFPGCRRSFKRVE